MPSLKPETAIRKLIADDVAIGALLGNRIFRNAAPQSAAYPLAVFDRDNTDVQRHMGGAEKLKHAQSTWTFYDEDADALDALAELVEALLNGKTPTVTIAAKSITFETLFLDDQTDQILTPTDGKGRPVFQIMQTYFVAYQNE